MESGADGRKILGLGDPKEPGRPDDCASVVERLKQHSLVVALVAGNRQVRATASLFRTAPRRTWTRLKHTSVAGKCPSGLTCIGLSQSRTRRQSGYQ